MQLRDFQIFAELPPEIRLQIWENALPPAQVIPVTYNGMHNGQNTPALLRPSGLRAAPGLQSGAIQPRRLDTLPPPWGMPITYNGGNNGEMSPALLHPSSSRSTPSFQYEVVQPSCLNALLHTNRESRAVYLNSHALHFQNDALGSSVRASFTKNPIYANFRVDTVYLASSSRIRDVGIAAFIGALPEYTRNSIECLAVDERVYNPVGDLLPPLEKLPLLKTLIVVQHEDGCRRDFAQSRTRQRMGVRGASSGSTTRKQGEHLQFVGGVVESVESAMWEWVDGLVDEKRRMVMRSAGPDDSKEWHFPKLRVVRLDVDGKSCCGGSGEMRDWLAEESDISDFGDS